MESPHDGIVDWQNALEIVNGDRGLLLELIEIFFIECPKLLDSIETAIQTQTPGELRRAAHTLKNNLRYFVQTDPKQLARLLELRGHHADFSDAPALLEKLRPEVARVMTELRAYAAQAKEHP